VRAFRAGVMVKDRTYRLRRYRACFTGVDAVRTLVMMGAAATIEEALAVGNALMARGIFVHVHGEHWLKNECLYYRFADEAGVEPRRRLGKGG